MTLFMLLFALLIEQMRPLPVQQVREPLQHFTDAVSERFPHGDTAWWVSMLSATLLTALLSHLLYSLHPLFAFIFGIGVFYLCTGFAYESRFFTDIDLALRMGQLDRARNLLAQWRGGDYRQADASEVARLTIEQALIAAHRNVFGLAFWFVILGPAGVVLYRLSVFLADGWGAEGRQNAASAAGLARRAFVWIDWLPQRLTAAAFSVAGNFEEAVYCWRAQAMRWRAQSPRWRDKTSAILLASGAGALGVRLGMAVHESGGMVERPELGVGNEADVNQMQGTVALIWRALVLCLLALALVTIAGWVGS